MKFFLASGRLGFFALNVASSLGHTNAWYIHLASFNPHSLSGPLIFVIY